MNCLIAAHTLLCAEAVDSFASVLDGGKVRARSKHAPKVGALACLLKALLRAIPPYFVGWMSAATFCTVAYFPYSLVNQDLNLQNPLHQRAGIITIDLIYGKMRGNNQPKHQPESLRETGHYALTLGTPSIPRLVYRLEIASPRCSPTAGLPVCTSRTETLTNLATIRMNAASGGCLLFIECVSMQNWHTAHKARIPQPNVCSAFSFTYVPSVKEASHKDGFRGARETCINWHLQYPPASLWYC